MNAWGIPGPVTVGPSRATWWDVIAYGDAASSAKFARKPWVQSIRAQLTSDQCRAAARAALASRSAPHLTHSGEMEYR